MAQYFSCPNRRSRFETNPSAEIRKNMVGISEKMTFSSIATKGRRTGLSIGLPGLNYDSRSYVSSGVCPLLAVKHLRTTFRATKTFVPEK